MCMPERIIIHILTHVDSFCAPAKCVDMLEGRGLGSTIIMMMKHIYLRPFAMCLSSSITSCQPSSSWTERDRESLRRWWWSTNTSYHLSCFHVFDHFNYMLSAGERDGERGVHAGESASDTCYTEWVREDTWQDREGKKEQRNRGQSRLWEKAGSREEGGYIQSESG